MVRKRKKKKEKEVIKNGSHAMNPMKVKEEHAAMMITCIIKF
jgi:hypothetical protein